jgi:spore photoproduct lyase
MECSYCYLQSYLNFPYMIIYANVDDLLGELDSVFKADPGTFFRIGTGELADSLALDHLTGYSVPLVEFFATTPNAVLELKTKSDCVSRLMGLSHNDGTIVGWSVNTEFVQEREEHKTVSIEGRLGAAEVCVENGYRVAFHFDPIVHYPGWREDYSRVVDRIFDRIPASSIAWISLGALRMTPDLKEMMRLRFKKSFLPLGELVPGGDGKLRYAKPIRLALYQHLLDAIRGKGGELPAVYACMERPEVWSRVFGGSPPSQLEVDAFLSSGLVQLEKPSVRLRRR